MCCVLVCVLVDSYLPSFGAHAASHSISGTHSNCDMFSHSRPVLDSCSNTLAVIGRVPGRTLYSAHQLEPPVMSIVSPIGVASLGSRYYVLAPHNPLEYRVPRRQRSLAPAPPAFPAGWAPRVMSRGAYKILLLRNFLVSVHLARNTSLRNFYFSPSCLLPPAGLDLSSQ